MDIIGHASLVGGTKDHQVHEILAEPTPGTDTQCLAGEVNNRYTISENIIQKVSYSIQNRTYSFSQTTYHQGTETSGR